jgi:hypothetical protein
LQGDAKSEAMLRLRFPMDEKANPQKTFGKALDGQANPRPEAQVSYG